MTLTDEQVQSLRTQWSECMADIYNAYGQFDLSRVPSLLSFNELLNTTLSDEPGIDFGPLTPIRSSCPARDLAQESLDITGMSTTGELRWAFCKGYPPKLQQKSVRHVPGREGWQEEIWLDVPVVEIPRSEW